MKGLSGNGCDRKETPIENIHKMNKMSVNKFTKYKQYQYK